MKSTSAVKKWAAEFKCGGKSTEDDPRSGRPILLDPDGVNMQKRHACQGPKLVMAC